MRCPFYVLIRVMREPRSSRLTSHSQRGGATTIFLTATTQRTQRFRYVAIVKTYRNSTFGSPIKITSMKTKKNVKNVAPHVAYVAYAAS